MAGYNEYQQQPCILDTNVNVFWNLQASPGTSSLVSSPSYNQFFSQMYASEMPNAQTVTGLIPRTCSLHWHSGMSPHKYYLTEKPTNVPNRCGCNKSFSLPYCQPPTNIIFKHIDKRIRGKIRDDQLIYNADFTPAYYHPIRSHIARKNPCYFIYKITSTTTIWTKLRQYDRSRKQC